MLCSFIMYRNGRINMYVKFLYKCAAFCLGACPSAPTYASRTIRDFFVMDPLIFPDDLTLRSYIYLCLFLLQAGACIGSLAMKLLPCFSLCSFA